VVDAGAPDAGGPRDGGAPQDGGAPDAGAPQDGGSIDAGPRDAGDMEVEDAGSALSEDGGTSDGGAEADDVAATLDRVGSPLWKPVGLVQSVAVIGTWFDNYAAYLALGECLLSPNHSYDNVNGGFGPGQAHAAPYDSEIIDAASGCGLVQGAAFAEGDFFSAEGGGVVLSLLLVPEEGGLTGSTPDYATGPVISDGLFPLTVDGAVFKDGELVDDDFDEPYASLSSRGGTEDGFSHVPLSWACSPDSFEPVGESYVGAYGWLVARRDANGDGWDVRVPFEIVFDQ